jgi:hypothetical protein
MSNKQLKAINRIKKAIAPLSPVLLKDIPRPQTVEEGRANLKRFYGCRDGGLVIYLSNHDLNGNVIEFPDGERVNGEWKYWNSDRSNFLQPHIAITKIVNLGSYFYVLVDPDKMSNLSDLYEITKSGRFNGAHDPSFTMNLIVGRDQPILECVATSTRETFKLLKDCQARLGEKYFADAWLKDPTAYRLYSNYDSALKRYVGFYDYSVQKGFNWRWREINNLETRYLHWLLLGPLAPYRYGDESEELAA